MKYLLCLFAFWASVAFAASPLMNSVVTGTSASVTGTSALALAANSNRKYLFMQNNGSVVVYVKFGSAHSGTEGIVLQPGASYEPSMAPTGSVYMKAASGTQTVYILEGN